MNSRRVSGARVTRRLHAPQLAFDSTFRQSLAVVDFKIPTCGLPGRPRSGRPRTAGGCVPSKKDMETGLVLVVDDDPKILELVRVYLQRAGYAVVTAVDGEDALREIEAHRPNLVVLDV